MGDRWLRRLAMLFAIVAVLQAIASLLLGSRGDPRFDLRLSVLTIGFIGTIVSFALVGALIVRRRPRTRVAWAMVGMGTLIGTGLLTGGYSGLNVTPSGENVGPLAFELLVLSPLLFIPTLIIGTVILLLLYPSDRLLGPRWRLVVAAAVVGALIWDIELFFHPGPIDNPSLDNVMNPFGAPAELTELFGVLRTLSDALTLPAVLLGAVSLLVRYRRGDQVERAQIRWFGLIAIGVIVSFVLAAYTEPNGELFFGLGLTFLALLPVAIWIAITRYRLYDIDLIINRAIVYGSLTAILAGVFAAGVGVAQRLFVAFTGESSDAAIVLVTLVVATLYAPLRKRLESIIDKRFKYETKRFGSYTDRVQSVLSVIEPARAATKLAAEAVAELGATGAAVIDGSGTVVASGGAWPLPAGAATISIILADAGPLRSLILGPDRRGREYRAEDIAALEEAGRLTAEAVAR